MAMNGPSSSGVYLFALVTLTAWTGNRHRPPHFAGRRPPPAS
jgi:hypothetical protein